MLSELTVSSQRIALVGLAKNTGKTETLAALMREMHAAKHRVGVTSVGRDGEEHDVIDFRISKPRIVLPGGSLVATTDELLSASGIPFELLEDTDVRTPLGRVLIARLRGQGAVEIAGPSAAEQVRAVSDVMLKHGATHVLVDGAIDRRAASSPDVADGLVMSTGAVLSEDLDEVIAQTRDAVELVRLPPIDGASPAGRRLSTLALSQSSGAASLVGEDGDPIELPPRFVLSSDSTQIGALLRANPSVCWLVVAGALPDRFLRELLAATRRHPDGLTVVVANATKVFLADRSVDWYRQQGIRIEVLKPLHLLALTINPLAPNSHRFDSIQLRNLLEETIAGVPVFDVLHPGYPTAEIRSSLSIPD